MKFNHSVTVICFASLSLYAQSTELFPGDGYLECALTEYSGYNECMATSADYPKGQWPAICNRYLTNITTRCGKMPGSFSPTYVILGLLYSPPGNASSDGFSANATSGTTTSLGNSGNEVVNVSVNLPLAGYGAKAPSVPTLTVTGSHPSVTQNQATYQTVLTSTTGDQIKAVTNVIDHSQDVFYVWLNATFTPGLDSTHKTANLTLNSYQGQPADIIPITVAELKNPTLIPASKLASQVKTLPDGTSVTQPGLNVLTAADFASILSFDPFASADPSVRPSSANTRYYDTGLREPLEGPDTTGSDLPARTIMLAQSTSTQIGHTTSQTYSSGVSLGVPGIGSVGLTVNQTITTSESVTSGTGQQASATLGSTTVGCCNSNPSGQGGTCQLDVFEDLLFQTYVFVPEAANCGGVLPAKLILGTLHPPVLSGTLLSSDGQALAYRPVTVTLANGKSLRLTTNRKGAFSLYEAENGTASVTFQGSIQNVTLAAGTTEAVSLVSSAAAKSPEAQ
jgi:hypothetical protein